MTSTKKVNKKSKNKTTKNKEIKFNKISPSNLLKLFSQKKVAIINTLDEHIVINSNPISTNSSFGKNFIDYSCSKIKKFDAIILYCANNTCNASQKYAEKLLKKCSSILQKILLYEGGIYEWSLLSFSFPEIYTFIDLKNNTELSKLEIEEYFNEMKHRPISIDNDKFPKIVINNQSNIDLRAKILDCKYDFNSLKNKVCVVTGGTSGLGLEVVKLMLKYGAKHVTLTYYHNKKRANDVEEQLKKEFNACRFYILKADARTKEGNILTFDLKTRKNKLKIDVGPIDCVDINAGIFGPANMHKKHIFNISEKDYEKTMDTNLTGYFLSLKYFVKQAIENNVINASAVCIKSIYGSTGSLFSNTAYQTSKHGVMGLVHQSAIELARPNKDFKIKYPIRVNAVSPTFTNTALTKPFLDKKSINTTIKQDNPTGNLANKEDVANAVIFLLSDKANSITGIDLPVDCGVLAESIPTYKEVEKLNNMGIEELSCCGDNL